MQFNLNTQRGREAFADVQFGSVKEWSVGFRSLDDGLERLPSGDNVRVIKALDWVEVSPVMRGASPDLKLPQPRLKHLKNRFKKRLLMSMLRKLRN